MAGTLVSLVDYYTGLPALGGPSLYRAITPSDSVALNPVPKSIYVGGAGNIAVKGSDGNTATLAVTAGQTLALSPSYVMATGTTATGLVALN